MGIQQAGCRRAGKVIINMVGMHPTSEALTDVSQDRDGTPAVGSVKIAAGVTPGHVHNLSPRCRDAVPAEGFNPLSFRSGAVLPRLARQGA